MKTLVIGSGAREHALVAALLRDPSISEVSCAPGNAGIARDVAVAPIDTSDAAAIAGLAADLRVDFVVIGPEVPLVAGAVDALADRGILAFGPTAAAAQLEGSKSFAKDVMAAAGVPTARSITCRDDAEAAAALAEFGALYVVKDDGHRYLSK